MALQKEPIEPDFIAQAKSVPVSRLDSRLPSQPFEEWFRELAGPGAAIAWETNDCGEQTGSGNDSGRDFPVCVEAEAVLPDGRRVVIRISAGTLRKGISRRPRFYDGILESGGESITLKGLSDLEKVLK